MPSLQIETPRINEGFFCSFFLSKRERFGTLLLCGFLWSDTGGASDHKKPRCHTRGVKMDFRTDHLDAQRAGGGGSGTRMPKRVWFCFHPNTSAIMEAAAPNHTRPGASRSQSKVSPPPSPSPSTFRSTGVFGTRLSSVLVVSALDCIFRVHTGSGVRYPPPLFRRVMWGWSRSWFSGSRRRSRVEDNSVHGP